VPKSGSEESAEVFEESGESATEKPPTSTNDSTAESGTEEGVKPSKSKTETDETHTEL